MDAATHQHHPISHRAELVDSLEAAFVERIEVCPLCDLSEVVACPACDGRGWILFEPELD